MRHPVVGVFVFPISVRKSHFLHIAHFLIFSVEKSKALHNSVSILSNSFLPAFLLHWDKIRPKERKSKTQIVQMIFGPNIRNLNAFNKTPQWVSSRNHVNECESHCNFSPAQWCVLKPKQGFLPLFKFYISTNLAFSVFNFGEW